MSNILMHSRSTVSPITNPISFSSREMLLIRQTVAKDTNDLEFDLFISYCLALRLDPRRRQIYAFVYNKDKPEKRKMSIIVGIDGLRTIADRTGCYRPDDEEPRIEYAESAKSPANPLGIIKAVVSVYKFSHNDWHRVTASAYYDEYAPLRETWSETIKVDSGETWKDGRTKYDIRPAPNATKVIVLDASGQWGKPRIMLPKCAEALALRKAWPDDFANVYGEEEMAQASVLDITPSEMAEAGAVESRLERIGSNNGIMIQWEDNGQIEPVAIGKMADRCFDFIASNKEEPSVIGIWADRNRHSLQEFWARAKDDALAVRQKIQEVLA